MATKNTNKVNTQDIDWSGGTNWSAIRLLMGDGTWTDKSNVIPTANTVFISKNGNDGTGIVERIDQPFFTLAAARAAVVAFYTGPTVPSSTNRILIKVLSGYYNEQLILANYVDWDLGDAVIDFTTNSATYTIDDNNIACDSIVYGNAQILRSAGAAALGAVHIKNSGSKLRLFADLINATIGTGVKIEGGINTIRSNVIATDGSNGYLISGGTNTLFGNISTTTGNGLFLNVGTSTNIFVGNIDVSGGNNCIESVGSATTYVTGILTSTIETITQHGGTDVLNLKDCRIVTTGAATAALNRSAGTTIIDNCTLIGVSANSITGSGNLLCYGISQTNLPPTGVTLQVGSLIIDSNVV